MKAGSPEAMKTNKDELNDWQEELVRLQSLLPAEGARNRIKLVELPALREKIEAQEAELLTMREVLYKVYICYSFVIQLN
jgi:hypothetical protein